MSGKKSSRFFHNSQKLPQAGARLPNVIFDLEDTLGPDTTDVYRNAILPNADAAQLFIKAHPTYNPANHPHFSALTGKPRDVYLRLLLGFPYEEALRGEPLKPLTREQTKIMDKVVISWDKEFEKFAANYKAYANMPELFADLTEMGVKSAYASGCGVAGQLLDKAGLLKYMQGGVVPNDAVSGEYKAIMVQSGERKEDEKEEKSETFSIKDKPNADIFVSAASKVLHDGIENCCIVEDAEKVARADNPDAQRFAKFKAIFLISKKEFAKGELLSNVKLVKNPEDLRAAIGAFMQEQKQLMADRAVVQQPQSLYHAVTNTCTLT